MTVNTAKARDTTSEITDKTIINACGIPPFTSCAYRVEARARAVRGNEYAHHATLNFFMDFLNRVGLETCYLTTLKRKRRRITFILSQYTMFNISGLNRKKIVHTSFTCLFVK